ncbi:O-antigen ligase [Listeria sp. SHR_NRA_18]|uniref:O-antigen ligase family protein n=1 Tax=Listeria sp. SHR_NRA_18 TaxID=2269046 RepID=UPI00051D2608|nr:O-antigen ligase family protein [Listeria sp. SHR_NRA_18]KGL41146.1 hypothetical protein EP56_11105 [Listeriaceae bacterium FSL A5-0209]
MDRTLILKMIFVLGFLVTLVLSFFYSIMLIVPLLIGIFVFSCFFTLKQLAELTWFMLAIASFFGSILSIPGLESLFLYRLLLPVQITLFLLTWDDWSWMSKRTRTMLLFLVGWLASALITIIWTEYQGIAFRNVYFMIEAIYLLFTAIYYLKADKKIEWLVTITSGVMAVNIGIGLYEINTGLHLSKSGLTDVIGNAQFLPSGIFFNPNDLASFLALFLPIILVYMHSRTIIGSLYKGLLVIGAVYIIIETQSRIAFVLILVILFLLLLRYSWRWGALALLCIPFVLQLPGMQDTINQVNQTYTDKTNSTDLRLDITNYTWQTAKESYFMGVGPGNVQIELAKYFPAEEQNNDGAVSVHNFLLEVLANYGLLSLLFLLAFLFYLFYRSWRYWLENKEKKVKYLIPLLITLAFPFIAFASSTTLEKSYIWISFGIVLAILNQYDKRMETKDETI